MTPTRSYSQHVVAWGATGTAAVTGQPADMVNRVTATTGTSGTRAGLYDRRHDTTDPTGARTLSVASSVTAAWATLELNPAVVRYGSTGGGDAPDFTQDNNGNLLETVLALPGGVLLTRRGGGAQVWSYPNLHGDVAAVTDAAGVKQGPTLTYDPYGTPLIGGVDNAAGDMDWGWLGQHQRPGEHQPGITPVTEMGARQYAPALGRFLETDPIEGGSDNDYDYSDADPVNKMDLDGRGFGRFGRV